MRRGVARRARVLLAAYPAAARGGSSAMAPRAHRALATVASILFVCVRRESERQYGWVFRNEWLILTCLPADERPTKVKEEVVVAFIPSTRAGKKKPAFVVGIAFGCRVSAVGAVGRSRRDKSNNVLLSFWLVLFREKLHSGLAVRALPPREATTPLPPPLRLRDDARDMPSTRGRSGESEALRDTLLETVNASVEAAQKRGEELLAEATEEAAKVTAAAEATKAEVEEMRRVVEKEVEGMRRKVQQDRAALEAEKAAMEEAHTFQNNKICLDVGGHRFETSRQTLTTVPDTYFCSMFSGRFELAPDAVDGSYFLDRDGTHFRHVLNFLRNPVSFTVSDMPEAQRWRWR
jgi:hypothetical protein